MKEYPSMNISIDLDVCPQEEREVIEEYIRQGNPFVCVHGGQE